MRICHVSSAHPPFTDSRIFNNRLLVKKGFEIVVIAKTKKRKTTGGMLVCPPAKTPRWIPGRLARALGAFLAAKKFTPDIY